MAIYYVRTDGNDSNAGTGPAVNQAWQTLSKALGATGIGSGDTLYIAPGDYRISSTITMNGTYSTTTYIIGNPTASQFSGVTAGRVLITTRSTNDYGGPFVVDPMIDSNSKSNIFWSNCIFEQAYLQRSIFSLRQSINWTVEKCLFLCTGQQQINIFGVTSTFGLTRNFLFRQCRAEGIGYQWFFADDVGSSSGANFFYNITFDRCINIALQLQNLNNLTYGPQGIYLVNCLKGNANLQNTKGYIIFKNCNSFTESGSGMASIGVTAENIIYNYLSNWPGNTVNGYAQKYLGYNVGYERLIGLPQRAVESTYGLFAENGGTSDLYSIPTLAGQPGYTSTGVPTTDFYGEPWSGNGVPHIGAYNSYATTLAGQYNPTEKVNDSITFTPNETSKSINVYLGSTGLGYTTSNLVAHYTRQSGTATTITLVNQTPTGSWVSGGFAEISSVNQPGLYRLDVPNAAFASGVQFVTVSVRGAAGTNGAYVRCQALDIPGTLLNTQAGIYTASGTIGARMLLTTADNRPLNVTTNNQTVLNPADLLNTQAGIYTASGTLGARLLQTVSDNRPVIVTENNQIQVDAGQTFSSGSGTTILDPILNSVGRWTLEGNTLTLYNADGTYLRRCNLTQLGLSLSPT